VQVAALIQNVEGYPNLTRGRSSRTRTKRFGAEGEDTSQTNQVQYAERESNDMSGRMNSFGWSG
jgi:hypothetical protein